MRRLQLAALLALCAGPLAGATSVRALQGAFSLGGRAGTLGIGPEVGFSLSSVLGVRGGAGLLNFEFDASGRFGIPEEHTAKLFFPSRFYTVGADVSLVGLRVGAGFLVTTGDPGYRITLDSAATLSIGDGTYARPDVSSLTARVTWSGAAPYVLLGFGSQTGPGLGFFADIGAVILPGATISLSATGDEDVLASQAFMEDLELQRLEALDDAGAWVGYWPIVSVGLRFGLGR